MDLQLTGHRAGDGTVYDIFGAHGPAVVLIHGLGLNRAMWRWQVEALARDYRVVVYDLIGHGQSPPPSGPANLAMLSQQLAGLLDDLAIDQAAIAGFSLGGMIARRFAMDHGERLWALAVISSPHRRSRQLQSAVAARAETVRAHGPAASVEEALARWFTGDFHSRRPDLIDQVRQWVLANRREVYANMYRVLVDGVDEVLAPHPPIAVPGLVMTGECDRGNSPEMARAIAAEMTDARLVVLPGLCHMAMIEQPQLFNDCLVNFLNGVRFGP